MKRDIYSKLLDWKQSKSRKPLLLRGARQTGKTYILKEFGRKEYDELHYFNFEEDPELDGLFSGRLEPETILTNLEIYAGKKIDSEKHLIVLDEIQASDRAINALKYFCEDAPRYHIAAAGSLLGIALAGPSSFPVGKVDFLYLYPLTIREFFDAVDAGELRSLIDDKDSFDAFPNPLHEKMVRYLRSYYFIGGMPEAVVRFVEGNDYKSVREVQNNILQAYELDFAKYATAPEISKLNLLWNSIPAQLARENKRFSYADIKKSARGRDYETVIAWLENAGLIYRSFLVKRPQLPLKGNAKRSIFKIFLCDVGLLGAMTKTSPEILIKGDRLFKMYEGALVDNYVAQQLVSDCEFDLHYWKSGSAAEVDFICQHRNAVYPLEAKAGINPKSKSLRSYNERYNPPALYRTTLLNLRKEQKLLNIPLYAISLFPFHGFFPDINDGS